MEWTSIPSTGCANETIDWMDNGKQFFYRKKQMLLKMVVTAPHWDKLWNPKFKGKMEKTFDTIEAKWHFLPFPVNVFFTKALHRVALLCMSLSVSHTCSSCIT